MGENLEHMQFNPKKLPLALDVKIPMFDVWKDAAFQHQTHAFPTVSCLETK
jgi:2-amino-4-hydroxy-6-hydroxymethyldihydropteridine diphosphokinase